MSEYRCPACNEPVAGRTMTVRQAVPGQRALDLGCGHVVTFEMLELVWGIKINGNPHAITFPPATTRAWVDG